MRQLSIGRTADEGHHKHIFSSTIVDQGHVIALDPCFELRFTHIEDYVFRAADDGIFNRKLR